MPLADRPDFKNWLERFEARHAQIHGDGPRAPEGSCDGCGSPLPEQISTTGLCLVCLAEAYGRERTAAAERIAGALRVALALDDETPTEEIRDAVDAVLDEHEAGPPSGEIPG